MSNIGQACEKVREISRGLAAWIRKQPAVYEESLTDRLLYEFSDKPPVLLSRKFTRHHESRKSGADCEWWFTLSRGAIGLRVQAKKLTSGADHYPGLAYPSGAGLQMKLLIDSADSKNFLAFYALYSGGTPGSNTMCGGGLGSFMDEGVFLAAAPTLQKRFIDPGRSRVEANALLGCSNPLSCLFCCPMVRESANGEPDAVYRYIQNFYSDFFSTSQSDNGRRPGYHTELPSYILELLQLRGEEIPDEWESEHLDVVRETKAVVVFDFRDTEEVVTSNQSEDEIPSPLATGCNNFLRELGCQFSGDKPGLIIEKLAEDARRSGLAPSFRTFVCLVRDKGYQFSRPGEPIERAFELLWGMLLSASDFSAAQQGALATMRLFCSIAREPSSSVSEQAFRVFEETAKAMIKWSELRL